MRIQNLPGHYEAEGLIVDVYREEISIRKDNRNREQFTPPKKQEQQKPRYDDDEDNMSLISSAGKLIRKIRKTP